jgi:hypothetical protein
MLADWTRRLKAWQPLGLRLGCLVLHTVEVPLIVNQVCPLDPLSLQSLIVLNEQDHALEPACLASLLGLNSALMRRLGHTLQDDGLVVAGSLDSSTQSAWSITLAGKQAIRDCLFCRPVYERRTLTFLASGDPSKSAQFVNINCCEWGESFTPAAGEANFNPADVVGCIRQNAGWKQRRGFPTDVLRVCGPAESSPAWKHVIIDRSKRCLVLLLHDAEGLHGFALQRPDWYLQSVRPCFTLSLNEAQDCFPGVTDPVPAADWLQAWFQWGQEHRLPTAELEACNLEPCGTRICLRVPPLIKAKIAPLLANDEGWLFTGTGAWKACANLELEI